MNLHDDVLLYIAKHDGALTQDIFNHVLSLPGREGTNRNYFYHVIRRLRMRGDITTQNKQAPGRAMQFITLKGLKHLRKEKQHDG